MEVILEGYLERNNVPSGKDWKRGYCVFRKHPTSGNKVLEFYKDGNWLKAEPRAVYNLLSNYDIAHSSNSTKKRFVFVLRTVDQEYELGAPSETLREQWMDELTKAKGIFSDRSIQNILQSFDVVLLNEDYIIKHLNGFMGTCQLVITDAEVLVVASGVTKIRWKFSTIRRYKSQTGTFVLEVGRKAPTGEGEYRFDTANPVQLFDVLDKAVKDRIRSKGIEVGTLTPSTEIPPKLPSSIVPPAARPTPPELHTTAACSNAYSHLNQIKTPPVAPPGKDSEYDVLFNSGRFNKQRMSEPTIPTMPHFMNNPRKLTTESKISKTPQSPEEEEAYEEMNAAKVRDFQASPLRSPSNEPRHSQRPPPPQPPPRRNPTLEKSLSTPMEENTYDSPTNKPTKPKVMNNVQQLADYDSLFARSKAGENNVNNNNADASIVGTEYSHLSHGQQIHGSREALKPLALNDCEETYDVPQPKKKPPPPLPTARRTLSKPQRTAPLPPPGRNVSAESKNVTRNKNLSLSAGAGGNVIMQLKKRNVGLGKNPSLDEKKSGFDLYDTPVSVIAPDGYNEVGDLISGEYNRVRVEKDADGYVTVPESTPVTEDGIYQVPK